MEISDAAGVVAELGPYTAVVGPRAWEAHRHRFPPPRHVIVCESLEEIALDRLFDDVEGVQRRADLGAIVGIGGGRALDGAKYLGSRTAQPVVLVPTMLASLAPFTNEVARRVRRQLVFMGEVSCRVVADVDLLSQAPPQRNSSGAGAVVAVATALWDWRFADRRDRGIPFSAAQAELGERCLRALSDAAADIKAGSAEGILALARILDALGAATIRSGHRRLSEGSEHAFLQAYEHRLGASSDHGALLGLATVAMASLQATFTADADLTTVDRVVDLLIRCGVAANPYQRDLDEGTFRGLLRHTVRFAIGEALPYSILDEADINVSASEEMWRQVWRVRAVQ